jgi:hypothetical protein
MTNTANTEKGEVSFEHDGQTYVLVLNTNALVKLQGLFNTKDAVAGIEEIDALVKKGSLEHVRGLFWAALQKYHPAVASTPEAAGDFLDDAGAAATAALLRVSGFGSPDAKDLEELARRNPRAAQAPRPRRGAGVTGTSTPASSAV